MATILLPTDFKDFLKLLNENAVEYLLVGGYAVGHHGYPRATGDMFADCWANREVTIIDDISVNVIDSESLKANKLASGRMKDLNDLKYLP